MIYEYLKMNINSELTYTTNKNFLFWKFTYEHIIEDLTEFSYEDFFHDMPVRDMYDNKTTVGEAILEFIKEHNDIVSVSEILEERFGFVPQNILALNTCYMAVKH